MPHEKLAMTTADVRAAAANGNEWAGKRESAAMSASPAADNSKAPTAPSSYQVCR
jgi:hypothetical protein